MHLGGHGGGDWDGEVGGAERGVEVLHGGEDVRGVGTRDDLVACVNVAERDAGRRERGDVGLDPVGGEGLVGSEALEVLVERAEDDADARATEGGEGGGVGAEEAELGDAPGGVEAHHLVRGWQVVP